LRPWCAARDIPPARLRLAGGRALKAAGLGARCALSAPAPIPMWHSPTPPGPPARAIELYCADMGNSDRPPVHPVEIARSRKVNRPEKNMSCGIHHPGGQPCPRFSQKKQGGLGRRTTMSDPLEIELELENGGRGPGIGWRRTACSHPIAGEERIQLVSHLFRHARTRFCVKRAIRCGVPPQGARRRIPDRQGRTAAAAAGPVPAARKWVSAGTSAAKPPILDAASSPLPQVVAAPPYWKRLRACVFVTGRQAPPPASSA